MVKERSRRIKSVERTLYHITCAIADRGSKQIEPGRLGRAGPSTMPSFRKGRCCMPASYNRATLMLASEWRVEGIESLGGF